VSGALGILWATLATGAFAVISNVRGRDLPVSALGGGLGWGIYLAISRSGGGDGIAFFAASAAIALYSELASRILSRPTTTYLVCALIPLVPGGGMYYMMSQSLSGDLQGTLSIGFATLSIAGSIATGVAVGSAVARLARRL
jgi:uncharacterized membrane protein YjjB (DUF3815 family)